MATSGASALEIWVARRTDGESEKSMSPDRTARAAAVPLSKDFTSTSPPYFLKKPSLSATIAIVDTKIGGIPGAAKSRVLLSAAAGRMGAARAATATNASIERRNIVPPSGCAELEFGLARLA